MADYYLVVEIEYVDYKIIKRGKAKIKREFDEPQKDLALPIMKCIEDFYAEINGCDIDSIDIDSITVLDNALFE